jgi:tRNA(fMet)-specific endonuclease VapC
MYALDTNSIAYFFRGEGRIAERLFACRPHDVGVPAVVAYELRYGIARLSDPGRRSGQLERFLASAKLLPFDDECARIAAVTRVALERVGTPIGPMDVLIAATAIASHAVLVTRNVREFRRIEGLQVENWYGT